MTRMKLLPLVCLISILLISSPLSAQNPTFDSKADSLSSLLSQANNDTSKVNYLLQLGWEIMYQNPDTAIVLGNQALELSTAIFSAPENGKKADIIQAAKKGISKSYANLAVYYFLMGEYAISLENHYKALEIRENMNDIEGLANTYNNMGLVFRFQGDYTEALEFYMNALKLNAQLGNRDRVASNLSNIGLVYSDLGNYRKSLEYYRYSLNLNKELDNKINMANTLNNMGLAYYSLKDYKTAIRSFSHALTINKEINNTTEIANNLGNIGATYEEEEEYDKASNYYQQALEINQTVGNKYGIIANTGNLGLINLLKKNYPLAEKFMKEALAIANEINALEFIKENNKNLSNLYEETGRFQQSLAHYHLYTAAKDSLFNNEKNEEIARLEMQHEIEKMEQEREVQKQIAIAKEKKKRFRKNTLQYTGIFVGLLMLALTIILLGFFKISAKAARSITFFAFLIFFEFILVILDPFVGSISRGEPLFTLLINVALAGCIFPINSMLESRISKKLGKN